MRSNAFGNLYANPLNPTGCVGAGCLVIPSTTRELPDAGESWKVGARVTHSIGKLNFGLGYIWGFNPQATDMVFKVTSVGCSNPNVGSLSGRSGSERSQHETG